jgi:hypothetical protein
LSSDVQTAEVDELDSVQAVCDFFAGTFEDDDECPARDKGGAAHKDDRQRHTAGVPGSP